MTEDGYIPVDSATLATRFPGVYAVGDVATVGVPKAGVFAEGAARVVAAGADREAAGGEPDPDGYDGRGSCYIEFGARPRSAASTSTSSPARSRPAPSSAPSVALAAEKEHFGSSRSARWFGR